ncbi:MULTISPECIES: hypothetical protein [Lactococcus]|uniref:Uncharacterized protein n=1 Tax=Lactococcus lactis subsp. cremoris TaxID=1359 RepID=A0ABR5EJ71_LACLC|nr:MULTISPECIES: hypothetical protein [Lactococcus]KKW74485.1 hypothetical protein VN93_0528 [Lactococcus cremoris]MCT0079857.1 hypothetical protein [Lactococcus lactis subsp. lactis]MCT0476558.1 hypothetical protein [Lactococcus cremoris]MDV4193010.1 hypothetical protein [Lactococcus lactis subsp. lactis]PAK66280.1 hypothetical protein B8W94_11280 [Lactococcus lactis]
MKNTRLFGTALRTMDEGNTFNLDVSSSMVSLSNLTFEDEKLPEPINFIENVRLSSNLTTEQIYLLDDKNALIQKSWAYKTNWLALYSVVAGAIVAVGFQVAAVADVGIIQKPNPNDPTHKENFYKKLNHPFLEEISNSAFKVGGVSYTKKVLETFLKQVKQYNQLGPVND